MNIGTVNLSWFDLIAGSILLCIWLAYDGSLVEDTAKWLKQILTRKT